MESYQWELYEQDLYLVGSYYNEGTHFPQYRGALREFLKQVTKRLAQLPVNYLDLLRRITVKIYEGGDVQDAVYDLTEPQLYYLAGQIPALSISRYKPSSILASKLIDLLTGRFGNRTFCELKEAPELVVIQRKFKQSKGFEFSQWLNRFDRLDLPEDYGNLEYKQPPMVLSGRGIRAALLEIAERDTNIQRAKESIREAVSCLMIEDISNAVSQSDIIYGYGDSGFYLQGDTTACEDGELAKWEEKLITQLSSELESTNTEFGDKAA